MPSHQQQEVQGSRYYKKKLKAKEVLKLYEAGERNFQGVILRGQSFKGQDLSGADFSRANIKGSNFSDAILNNTTFVEVTCGLQQRYAIYLLFLSWILAVIVMYATLLVLTVGINILENIFTQDLLGLLALPILLIVMLLGLVGIVATMILALAVLGGEAKTTSIIVAFVLALILTVLGMLISTELGWSILIVIPILFNVTIRVIARAYPRFNFPIVLLVISPGILVLVSLAKEFAPIFKSSLVLVVIILVLISAVSILITKQFIEVPVLNHPFTTAFTVIGGTSFRGADLADANFTRARLKSTDFREASLVRVCWYKAQLLERVCSDDSYLKDSQLRKFILGEATDKNFSFKVLRYINLQGNNLSDANLQDTDLSGANLQDTDLSGANLLRAHLDGANLTGACIKDWHINSGTNFENLICDYIYLKEGQKERRPSDPNRIFKPGEFAKYIEKALYTVDLIFTDGIDWKAFSASFQTLQDEYGTENIGVQAIEKKTGDTFVVRIEVPLDSNKAEIESHTKHLYESNLKVLEDKYRSELNAKDREIEIHKQKSADILELAKLAASRPITVEAKAMVENQSKNVEVEMNINAPSKGVVGKMTGDMNIYTSEQKQSLTEVATEIVKLLDYFEQNDPSITEAQQIVKTSTENQPEILDAEIVQEAINSSPTLRQRIGAAGKAAYIETVKTLLPPFGIAYEAYQAYKNPES